MAYKGLFVGIGKHQDPLINDLAGARRDALALWSLFTDNLEGIQTTLLVDEQATCASVKRALSETLQNASEEDIVFISFAGHGSEDHQLVTFDTATDPETFLDSTIAMSELADLFSTSQAKAVICVLDCCFSGGAPARVFPGRPSSRAYKNVYATIAGKGRVLLAACAIDEAAYEDPRSAHGIFTKALLEALQSLDEPTEILAVATTLAQRVRANAARMGVKQTPVVLGQVEGGLVFSTFVKGQTYLQHFPDLSRVKTDGTIASLTDFGIPTSVTSAWDERFRGEQLNGLQLQAINEERVLDGHSLLVVAPTSSGKTFIGEAAALKGVLDGRKAVMLLPYKALTNEKFDEFSQLYGEQLGLRVIRCTGDRTDTVPQFIRGKYDLALLTYEMFLNLVVSNAHLLRSVGLVVVDEAQFITDPNRGISVELLLTFLLASQAQGVQPQIIALSAVIGGVNAFDEWLGCKTLSTHKRPVPLAEGVLDCDGIWQRLEPDGTVTKTRLLPESSIVQRRSKPSSQDVIVPLVQKLLADDPNEKVLIFRNQRGSAQGCANYLAADLGLPGAVATLAELSDRDPSEASQVLRTALAGGTAFHTTNLTRDEKQVVERVYRDPTSPVRVLAATTGVAAGINTPASTVIIAEQEFLGEDSRPFTVAEYKNMAGRAGRKGFNSQGKSIILANTSAERERLFASYVVGDLEPITSSFDDSDLSTWILKLLTQVDMVARADVTNLLATTYGGFLNVRRNPDWLATMRHEVAGVLERMVVLELVEVTGDNLRLSLLGRVCGRSSFSFDSAMVLVELLSKESPGTLTPERLLALLQVLPEADSVYTPVFKRGTRENARPHDVDGRYGIGVARLLSWGAHDNVHWLARCKRAAILWDWVNGIEIAEIEAYFSPTTRAGVIRYGHITGFANLTRYHLRSAAEILQVLVMDANFDAERLDQLLIQLEEGLSPAMLELLELPVELSRGEVLDLYRQGLSSPNKLETFDKDMLVSILSQEKATQLLDKVLETA